MATASKNRYWAFLWCPQKVVPGLPHNIEELTGFLSDTHLKFTISPFHCHDINPDGTAKFEHYHVMVCWDGPTTYKNAASVLGTVAINGHLESVCSARGMYRYFVHADNPEKYQYEESERINGNGFNPADLMSETDKQILKLEVRKYIKERGFSNFYEVDDFLISEGLIAHWSVFQASSNYFNHLLKGKRFYEMGKAKKDHEALVGSLSSGAGSGSAPDSSAAGSENA